MLRLDASGFESLILLLRNKIEFASYCQSRAMIRTRGWPIRRTGHNLVLRLRDRKADVLRFLTDLRVPFTNNEAERDLRMGKVRIKVSGCIRTPAGAENCCTLRAWPKSS